MYCHFGMRSSEKKCARNSEAVADDTMLLTFLIAALQFTYFDKMIGDTRR